MTRNCVAGTVGLCSTVRLNSDIRLLASIEGPEFCAGAAVARSKGKAKLPLLFND
uniref:Uncharacterized protein n=1 Tax=Setaria digitata TaxID=48799 RepID=A0A915PWJ5_9BILA